jgi:hypothetical protein
MEAHNMHARKKYSKPISSGIQVLNSTTSKYSAVERNLEEVKRRTRRAFVSEKKTKNSKQGFVEKYNNSFN